VREPAAARVFDQAHVRHLPAHDQALRRGRTPWVLRAPRDVQRRPDTQLPKFGDRAARPECTTTVSARYGHGGGRWPGCTTEELAAFQNADKRAQGRATHPVTEFAPRRPRHLRRIITRADEFMWLAVLGLLRLLGPDDAGTGGDAGRRQGPREAPAGDNLRSPSSPCWCGPTAAGRRTPKSWSYDEATREFPPRLRDRPRGGGSFSGARSRTSSCPRASTSGTPRAPRARDCVGPGAEVLELQAARGAGVKLIVTRSGQSSADCAAAASPVSRPA